MLHKKKNIYILWTQNSYFQFVFLINLHYWASVEFKITEENLLYQLKKKNALL